MIDSDLVPKRTLYDGTKMPAIGMGTFGSDRYSAEEVSKAVEGAIEIGYRLIDCAAVYGNEDSIGKVLERVFQKKEIVREDLFITSKVWNDMHGQGDVLLSCAKSLKDLKLDSIDLYFVHWPFPNYHAPGCDGNSRNPDSKPFCVEEFMKTWRQCERLVKMGLVKHIGMSNMTIPKLEAVLPLCNIQPAACEAELHPTFQQEELFTYLKAHQIEPIGFSPIGSPKRPDRDIFPDDFTDIAMPQLVEIANAHKVHPALVCIKWAVQRGQTPIPFSIHKDKYLNNLKCVIEDPLTAEEMKVIRTLERNNRLIKGQVFLWPGADSWRDLWDMSGVITK